MSVDGVYHFKAGAPDGGVFSGRLKASSSDDALAQLRQKGFVPLRLAERPIRERWFDREIGLGGSKRLSGVACEQFCRELALLLGSSVVVVDAIAVMLPTLKAQSGLKAFAAAIRNGLRLGRSLSQAAESAGYTLPPDLVPVLRSGEEAGSLPAALNMLADSYADGNRFARIYVSALAYPALLLCVSVAVLGLIAFFVAPSLAGLFVSMERPAPFAIAALAGAAGFVSANGVWLLIAGAATSAAFVAGASNVAARQVLRRAIGRLPVIGTAMRWSQGGRFAATLQLCLASGVPIGAALPNALVSAGFARSGRTQRLLDDVRSGKRLSDSLRDAALLPDRLVHLVAVGESSGRLVEVLAGIVSDARNRFEQRMTLLTALLAPGLILIVGSLIGTVIFSVFSALLEMNEIAF